MSIATIVSHNFNGFHIGEENKDVSLGVPLELLNGNHYKNLFNNDRLLYSFLLFKKATDIEENFYENDLLYRQHERKELATFLGVDEKRITESFTRLEEVGLVKIVRQGRGMPNKIFLGQISFGKEAEGAN